MKFKDYDPIVLASQSPRRKDILESHGITPLIRPTDTDESLPEKIGMEDAVIMLAREKAEACLQANSGDAQISGGHPLIIAADTIVYKDEIMGKPADHDDAVRMLKKIRNTVHYVVTGVCLIDPASHWTHAFAEVTEVWCKDYTDEEIETYIEEAQPYDKAGAYAIQGIFGKYIDHFTGDYENVVGLPYERIVSELDKTPVLML